ncbi:MAG TPA: hypothetical protein VMU17_04785, partial [Elusimicrobiota bacterium]|nr:hypothetical protein [Elusimicrobiota bacterium]
MNPPGAMNPPDVAASAGQASSMPEAGALQAPFMISVGAKMLLATCAALVLSFTFCLLAGFSLARRMLRVDLQMKVSSESRFLADASRTLVFQAGAPDRAALAALAQHLLQEPEITAVRVLDNSRHVLAHVSRSFSGPSFSLQVPILNSGRPIGFVRAWYSPLLALWEYWNSTGYIVGLLFAATFVLFSVSMFLANEWILSRPFRRFIRAVEMAQAGNAGLTDSRQALKFPERRRDEWGVLSARLRRYVQQLQHLQERSTVLYETASLLNVPDGM